VFGLQEIEMGSGSVAMAAAKDKINKKAQVISPPLSSTRFPSPLHPPLPPPCIAMPAPHTLIMWEFGPFELSLSHTFSHAPNLFGLPKFTRHRGCQQTSLPHLTCNLACSHPHCKIVQDRIPDSSQAVHLPGIQHNTKLTLQLLFAGEGEQ